GAAERREQLAKIADNREENQADRERRQRCLSNDIVGDANEEIGHERDDHGQERQRQESERHRPWLLPAQFPATSALAGTLLRLRLLLLQKLARLFVGVAFFLAFAFAVALRLALRWFLTARMHFFAPAKGAGAHIHDVGNEEDNADDQTGGLFVGGRMVFG